MRRRLSGFLACVALLTAGSATARKTVAIAPLSTTSSTEYQWIGPAIAGALSLRVHKQPELNALTQRQVNSAMRQDNIEPAALANDDVAIRLGRQLGADVILVGTYTAAWPDISIVLKAVDPQAKKVLNTTTIDGGLDELLEVEARAAASLARELGAEKVRVTPGAFGTDSLRAWHHTTLGLQIINWQSLSPRAADPNAPLSLPEPAVERARDHFEKATQYDPDYGEAWAALGVTRALLGDTKNAWRSFGKATALGFGHHPTAVLGASFVRMRQGRLEDAAKILKSAIANHPGFLHARGYLGELYNHQGRRREALDAFQKYHDVTPKNPWVLAQLGYTKSKMGDHIGAIADSITAVDTIPSSPSLLIELASRYIDARKFAGAEDALQHAAKLFPSEARIFVRLGYVQLQLGRDDLAIPTTKKGLALAAFDNRRRDRGYAHLNLARAYGHQGELDQAFDHLGKAMELGITSFRELEKDPKLTIMRADPRYANAK